MDEEDELRLLRERQRLQLERWKSYVSLFLLTLCGLIVVGIPACSYALRVVAWYIEKKPPDNDPWMSFNCGVGMLAIMSWGLPAVLPLVRLLRGQPAPEADVVLTEDQGDDESTES